MSGWETWEESWEKARQVAKDKNATDADLMQAGAAYLMESVPDIEEIGSSDMSGAVVTLVRLGMLEDYLEAAVARREASDAAHQEIQRMADQAGMPVQEFMAGMRKLLA